jgi:hypothetical protein
MTSAISGKKAALLDKKVDQFCKSSAELLAEIHERYNNTDTNKPKRKRKKKRKKTTNRE